MLGLATAFGLAALASGALMLAAAPLLVPFLAIAGPWWPWWPWWSS